MPFWTVYISVYNSRADRAETRMDTGFGEFLGDTPLSAKNTEKPLRRGFFISLHDYM
jgi:hypothetical protein